MRRSAVLGRLGVCLLTAGALVAQATPARALTLTDVFPTVGTVKALSVTPAGRIGNGGPPPSAIGYGPSVSGNGRFVAFASEATNLVAGDTNGARDVFRRDLVTGRTIRVVLTDAGAVPTLGSFSPSISADGTKVAFVTAAGLIPGDTRGGFDVYVHDLVTRRNTLVTVSTTGASADNGGQDPVISADGRSVAFVSQSTDLVSPGVTDLNFHAYVRDLVAGTTRQVDVPAPGIPPGVGIATATYLHLSATGRYVVFATGDQLLPGVGGGPSVYRFDRQTGTTALVANAPSAFTMFVDGVSANGRFVAISTDGATLTPQDTAEDPDCFVKDLQTGTVTLISRTAAGAAQVLPSYCQGISNDGAWVLVVTNVAGMAPGDTNTFSDLLVVSRTTGAKVWASRTASGGQLNASVLASGLSGNGAMVAFGTAATNVVAGDANARVDFFQIRVR